MAIARALILRPKIIIADEPTSMLDVAVRTSIMRLMLDLQQRNGFSYLYITHDMGVARYMASEVAVMYLGKVVEMGHTDTVIGRPTHPYTQALLSAVLSASERTGVEFEPRIKGSVSKPVNPPPECRFLERCLYASDKCRSEAHPPLSEADGRRVACYHPQSG